MRKIANPAFGIAEAKTYIPWFLQGASKVRNSSSLLYSMLKSNCQLTERWKDMIDKSAESSLTISIAPWLHRATLDILGESTSSPLPFILFTPTASFGYEFNTLVDDSNALANQYKTCVSVAQLPSHSLGLILNCQHRNSLPPELKHNNHAKSSVMSTSSIAAVVL